MRKFLVMSLVLCMILGVLASCNFDNDETDSTTPEVLESESESESESASSGSTSESESESTEVDEEQEHLNNATAELPTYNEDVSYTTGDGYELKQYNLMALENYYSAYKYYLEEGYTVYSKNQVGNSKSATFVKGDAYAIVMFNGNSEELYLGYSESGAEAFPEVLTTLGDDSVVPTITQHYSEDQNGMCYFIKLSDGSFLVLDGGYDFDTDHAYETLVELNGSEDGIHIRAWLITHAHADHYEMFETFSQEYADKVTLERVMYSPINRLVSGRAPVVGHDAYLNELIQTAVARFDGAVLCPVHTGMSFTFGNIEFEILAAPEHIYKQTDPEDFNETSVVTRAIHKDGSMIFLGDCGVYTCNWMLDAYDDGLKSDIVQVAHHGGETANADIYDAIQAHTLFWPCNEPLLNSFRGGTVKQHILEAEYSKEHLLHGYGNITRPINYKAEDPEYINLFPANEASVNKSSSVDNVRIEDGVLKYDVIGNDPFIYYDLRNVSTTKCNAIRVVIGSDVLECGETYDTLGELRYAVGSESVYSENPRIQRLGPNGESEDGTTTIIIYLGDTENYTGRLSTLRWDLGTEVGQTVEIYSVEGFYINIDAE